MFHFYLIDKMNEHKYIILIFIFYFTLRLINLTTLPIFNDEAIYLDWGWRMTHVPGNLYFSLYDGKQPLLMWIFGIFESFLPDPLFAGRLVSVLAGSIALLGIYRICIQFFNKKIAYLATIFYIITPLFSFYDRQALMESSISAVNIWSCYFFLRFSGTPIKKYAIWIGAILGIGFFIKSSSLILIFTYLILGVVIFLIHFKTNKMYIKNILVAILVILMINMLLLINPSFWNTFYLNNRYSMSITELLSLPLLKWLNNTVSFLEISLWHTTLLSILAVLGVVSTLKGSNRQSKYLASWMVITFLLLFLLANTILPRYVVSFLPFISIFSAHFIYVVSARLQKIAFFVCCFAILTSFSLLIVQIFSPLNYFSQLSKVTKFSQRSDYVTAWTSGYGIENVRKFLSNESKNTRIIAAVRIDAGNPESSVFTYYARPQNIIPIYLDGNINREIEGFDCIKSSFPIYFISRDEQLANLNKFLTLIKKINKPEKKSFIGIYKVNSTCKGKILIVDESSLNIN